jgi:hypothetical protein
MHPERDADDDLEDDRHDGQPDGDRERGRHQLGDLLAVERRPEVTGEDVPHVGQVLLPHGLVEAELPLELGGRRRVALPVAAQARDGVAHHVHHQEDQQCGADEDRDHLQQTPDYVPSHGGSGDHGSGPRRTRPRCDSLS